MAVGQAVGTAAALCVRHGVAPRELGKTRIAELQQQLLKDDHYIPGVVNADPLDLARTAAVSATSGEQVVVEAFGKDDPGLRTKYDDAHALNLPRAVRFTRAALERLEAVELLLVSKASADAPFAVQVVGTDDPAAGPEAGVALGTLAGTVPAGRKGFVACRAKAPISLRHAYVWLVAPARKDVSWLRRGKVRDAGARRAWRDGAGAWHPVDGQSYAFVTAPRQGIRLDAKPSYVTDGTARPVGACVHGWVSDPKAPLPQALTLTFPRPVAAREVRLAFDSDLTPLRAAAHPKTLVKAYVVEGLVDGAWTRLASDDANVLRHRVHAFGAVTVAAIRVTVSETWGDPSARIFEIRAY